MKNLYFKLKRYTEPYEFIVSSAFEFVPVLSLLYICQYVNMNTGTIFLFGYIACIIVSTIKSKIKEWEKDG